MARYELGEDVNLDRVEMLSKWVLARRLEFVKLNRVELLAWVSMFWVLEVGYAPQINLMVNGWIIFIFMDKGK